MAGPFFHPPKQSRSQQTLHRISSAALEIMEEEGVGGATIAAIVERAEASVGSFYARFPGKSDLVRYLQERVWTEARERWDQALEAQAWEGLPMVSLVEGVAGLLLRSIRADFHRRKVLGREGISDPETARRVIDFHEHILATVTPLFLSRSQEMTHPDPSVGIRFGYLFVVGAIREFLELEETQTSSNKTLGALSSPDRLGPELARAWMGYLSPGAQSRTAEDEGEVDFFDPWG
jgi:AcrR family transcriptional regulator